VCRTPVSVNSTGHVRGWPGVSLGAGPADRHGGRARFHVHASRPYRPTRPPRGRLVLVCTRSDAQLRAEVLALRHQPASWSARSASLPGSLVIASCSLASAGCSGDHACLRCCRGRRPCSAGTAIWSTTSGPPSAIALLSRAARAGERSPGRPGPRTRGRWGVAAAGWGVAAAGRSAAPSPACAAWPAPPSGHAPAVSTPWNQVQGPA